MRHPNARAIRSFMVSPIPLAPPHRVPDERDRSKAGGFSEVSHNDRQIALGPMRPLCSCLLAETPSPARGGRPPKYHRFLRFLGIQQGVGRRDVTAGGFGL